MWLFLDKDGGIKFSCRTNYLRMPRRLLEIKTHETCLCACAAFTSQQDLSHKLNMLFMRMDVDENKFVANCNTLQHAAARCNTLQHAATHCNTLQHTLTLCNTL